MRGLPVWLASLSRKELGSTRIKGTGTWSKEEIEAGYRRLCWALRGCGDPERERLFRMCVTLCLHRAATDQEIAGLPTWWHQDEGGLAGGPVEVLWSRGIACTDSCRPCHSPGRLVPDPSRPDLWVPTDCKKCKPCLARAFIAQYGRSPSDEEFPLDFELGAD